MNIPMISKTIAFSILILSLFIPTTLASQVPKYLDSLSESSLKIDTIKAYYKTYKFYKTKDWETAYNYIDTAFSYADQKEDVETWVELAYQKLVMCYYTKRTHQLEEIIDEVEKLHIETGENHAYNKFLILRCYQYRESDKLIEAEQCLEKVIKLSKEFDDVEIERNAIGGMSQIAYERGDLVSATKLLKSSYNHELTDTNKGIYWSNLGAFAVEAKTFEKALEYLHKAIESFKKANNNVHQFQTNINIVMAHFEMNNPDSAQHYIDKLKDIKTKLTREQEGNLFYSQAIVAYIRDEYQFSIDESLKAIVIFKELEDLDYIGTLYSNMGAGYLGLNKFSKAKLYLTKADSILRKVDSKLQLNKNTGLLVKLNLWRYQDKKPIEKFEEYLRQRDSIMDIEVRTQVNFAGYEMDKRIQQDSISILNQKQILIEEKLKFNRWKLWGTSLLILAMSLISYLLYKGRKNSIKQSILQKEHIELLKDNELFLNDKNQELKDYNTELISALQIENNKPEKLLKQEITLSDRQKTTIKLEDIIYLESKNKAILVHTIEGKSYKDWQSLKSYSEILPNSIFQRVNRSTIINSTHIISRQKSNVSLTGGIDISIGAAYTNEEE